MASALALALFASSSGMDVAHAVPNEHRHRPSRWAPSKFASLLDQDGSWGNVAYWWQWAAPNNTGSSIYDAGAQKTLELGWKRTGNDGCGGRDGALNRTGFPPDVNIQNDHTEDAGDAVIWIADLNLLRADVTANPSKEYSVWWRCDDIYYLENGVYVQSKFRGNETRPYLEVQNGHWDQVEAPNFSYSDATLHYVPAENGFRGVPAKGSSAAHQTDSWAPWTNNWNFENGTAGWGTSGATAQWFQNQHAPETGSAYVYLLPTNPNAGWIYQDFKVRNDSIIDGGPWIKHPLGSNTDYQFEGTFRCPTFAPGYYSKGTNYCVVDVWIKTSADSWTNKGFRWHIPADGTWYFVLSEAWSAQVSDDDISIWINNNGYPLDIDVAWVTSGL